MDKSFLEQVELAEKLFEIAKDKSVKEISSSISPSASYFFHTSPNSSPSDGSKETQSELGLNLAPLINGDNDILT